MTSYVFIINLRSSLFHSYIYTSYKIDFFIFFFNDTATTEIYTPLYTLSLHDALPISRQQLAGLCGGRGDRQGRRDGRSLLHPGERQLRGGAAQPARRRARYRRLLRGDELRARRQAHRHHPRGRGGDGAEGELDAAGAGIGGLPAALQPGVPLRAHRPPAGRRAPPRPRLVSPRATLARRRRQLLLCRAEVHVLLIEDDAEAARFLVKGLRESGYSVDHAVDGREGLNRATEGQFDLIDRKSVV